MKKWFFLLFSLSFWAATFAQNLDVEVLVTDKSTKETLPGAHIKLGNEVAVTNIDGLATISIEVSSHQISISYLGYKTIVDTIKIDGTRKQWAFELEQANTLLNELVVTGSRHETEVAKSTVTIDLIDPKLIERNNFTAADQALQRVPGLEIIDDQPSIRGGAGYSYGAGSRVLVLLDDIPILQADAGFPQWNDLPIELTSQIEILKGASSALYGSSALNGIINLRTSYAKSDPETQFTSYATLFSKPGDPTQAWWSNGETPREIGSILSHKQKLGKTDLVMGMFAKNLNSFNRDVQERYWRYSGSILHHPNERLEYGFNFNVNTADNSEFFFWKDIDSLYVGASGTESIVQSLRYNIDPKLTYYSSPTSKHRVLARYHYVNNETNANRSNQSSLGYLEYQFSKELVSLNANMHAGLVGTGNSVSAKLYGDQSFNAFSSAAYLQWDHQLWHRLNYNIGLRYEQSRQSVPSSVYDNWPDDEPYPEDHPSFDESRLGKRIEGRPVLRTGISYQLATATFLRASYGQGYRYPTIAEQYITTTFGGVPISSNPVLYSETGTSFEFGLKQGFQIKKYQGFVDVAAFRSVYENMIEFNFVDLFPTGFKSVNVGGTDIRGIEASLIGAGKIGGLEITHLIGFNHIIPRFKEFDQDIVGGTPTTEGQLNAHHSSYTENVLKYRYNTTFKFDLQLNYKQMGLGFSGNYYSHMLAIDAIFEDFIVPDLKQYREENNKGINVINARLSYEPSQRVQLSVLANNLLNSMYSLRPGLMEAPRNYSLRLRFNL